MYLYYTHEQRYTRRIVKAGKQISEGHGGGGKYDNNGMRKNAAFESTPTAASLLQRST